MTKLSLQDAEHIWVTSDHHFGHENLIFKYHQRDFKSADEMNSTMILCWNEVVKDDDIVIHLGDLTLENWKRASEYISMLKGKISLLDNPWHHDKKWREDCDPGGSTGFVSKSNYLVTLDPPIVVLEVDIGQEWGLPIVLCHYPFAEWDRKHYGAIHLHGHSHGTYKSPAESDRIMDVGVDCNDFYPVNLYDAIDYFGPYNDPTKEQREV